MRLLMGRKDAVGLHGPFGPKHGPSRSDERLLHCPFVKAVKVVESAARRVARLLMRSVHCLKSDALRLAILPCAA